MVEKGLGNWVKYLTFASTYAITLAGMVGGGYLLGNFLDSRWGTDPVLKIVLMLLGVFLGVAYLIFYISKLEKPKNE